MADPPTIVIHPGPKGDPGLSALDWAVMVGEPTWGTALQAVQEIDAGPIWPSRKLPAVPADPPRKSTLYNGPITDTAARLIHEVITKAADPDFRPEPGDYTRPRCLGSAGNSSEDRRRSASPHVRGRRRRTGCSCAFARGQHRAVASRWPAVGAVEQRSAAER